MGRVVSEELERAAEYRSRATYLLERGEGETDAGYWATWVEMAALYKKMAEQLEEIHRRAS